MSFAHTLTDAQRRFSSNSATFSAMCGCLAEMAFDSGAVIVIYIALLGGSDAAKMMATSFSPIATVCFGLVFGAISDRFGLRRAITNSSLLACAALIMIALAPFTGSICLPFCMVACFLYCMSRPLYATAWYPILDNFLRPEDRSRFLSTMRFSYSTLNACLLFGLGRILASMGGHPPMWFMQLVIVMCAAGQLGRMYFLNRIPLAPEFKNPPLKEALHNTHGQKYSLKEGIRVSFRNGPLVGFCIYFCIYNIIITSYIPLSVVYMKSDEFNATSAAIMTVTAVSLAGNLIGYLCCTKLVKSLGTKYSILLCHCFGVILPAVLFFCSPTNPHRLIIIGAVQFTASFIGAQMMVINSMESLALARPGNKTIALAVCNFFNGLGTAVGRFGVTAALACGILAPHWNMKGMSISKFQSIFAIDSIAMIFIFVLLILLPAFVPQHDDYYEP